ncbi:hypothetical protein LUZ61_003621 [Rhynchospora tenuis]|uniref:AB hydrolase-1 domain-containing protein n=1 Tax=Rhynchospora tenuis TaxID=198213 RepID=A0AAD5ZL41_9POAL|nr:hypothetical protein LUZ61_003621 [Rhynchospora tenuis]
MASLYSRFVFSQLSPKPNIHFSKTNAKPLGPLPTFTFKPTLNCTKQDQSTLSSRHFVLVHGAGHGGWVWYKLATKLNEAGHRVSAPDLAASGINPKRLEEVNTFEEYSEPLVEVMEAVPADERVVLVGHSNGGLSVSLAMERFPQKVAAAVFTSAAMPSITNSFVAITKKLIEDVRKDKKDSKDVSGPRRSFSFGPEDLRTNYYQLCAPEDVTLATMLMRPGKPFFDSSVSRDDFVTAENHGSVSRVYVVCNQGRALPRKTQIWMAEMSPETETIELDGADNMPMLSVPEELFSHLVDISNRYQ